MILLSAAVSCASALGSSSLVPVGPGNDTLLNEIGLEVKVKNGQDGCFEITIIANKPERYDHLLLSLTFPCNSGGFSTTWNLECPTNPNLQSKASHQAHFSMPYSSVSRCNVFLMTSSKDAPELELYETTYCLEIAEFTAKCERDFKAKTKAKRKPNKNAHKNRRALKKHYTERRHMKIEKAMRSAK